MNKKVAVIGSSVPGIINHLGMRESSFIPEVLILENTSDPKLAERLWCYKKKKPYSTKFR